jgi:hypothetical protein
MPVTCKKKNSYEHGHYNNMPTTCSRVYSSTAQRHTDLSNLVNVSGHDADLASTGFDDAGAVGTNQAGRLL